MGNVENVRAQCRDVPERGAANVATLGSNVATFQRGHNPTSRRWDPTSQRFREGIIQHRDVGIQRRSVPEGGTTNVVTLQHCDIESQRRYFTKEAKIQTFHKIPRHEKNPPMCKW